MEDFYENKIDGVVWEIVGLFGVFDGHGGGWAAEYVKHNLFSNQIKHSKFIFDKESVIADAYSQIDPEFLKASKYFQKNLFSNLMNHPNFITDTKSSIEDAFNHTDIEFLKVESEGKNQDSGSAATTAILLGNHSIVANVGDSRAVICRDGNALLRDHKPDLIDEHKRVEDAGGFVVWCDAWRVCGVLALSRAFGNRFLKQFVVAGLEIQETIVDSSLEFLILASDGLWDVVTNEAVALIRFVDDPKEAAKRLMVEAYRKGSSNKTTCHVVRFLWDECGGARSSSLLRFQCGGASNSSLPTCQCDGASSSDTSTCSST